RAEMLLEMKQFAEAGQSFGLLATKPGFESAHLALYRQAYCSWQLNDFAAAAEQYAAVARTPNSPHAQQAGLMSGRSLFHNEDTAAAKTWLQSVVVAAGDVGLEAAHWLARVHLHENQPTQALQVVDTVLSGAAPSPFSVNLLMDRADALQQIPDRLSEVPQAYLVVARNYKDHELAPHGLYHAIFASLDLKHYAQGIELVKEFMSSYSTHELARDVRHAEAECRLMNGDTLAAEQIYRELTAATTNHKHFSHWLVRLAYTQFLQAKYDEAVATLQANLAHIQASHQVAEAMMMIGASHFHQQNFDHALAALLTAIEHAEHHEKTDEALLYLARTQRELDQLDESLKSLQRLVQDHSQSVHMESAFYWQGENHFALKDYEAAAATYGELYQRWPKSTYIPHALSGQGWCSFRLQRYAQGIKAFSELIEKYASHSVTVEASYGRALCHYKQQEHEQAVNDLEIYLKSEPPMERRANALYLQGLSLIEMKQYQEAIQSLTTLLEQVPDYSSVDRTIYQLAWTYKMLDLRPESIQWYTRLTEQYKSSSHLAEAHYHLAENDYWHEENYAAAQTHYQRCLELTSDAELTEKSLYMHAWCHYQQQQFTHAYQQFTLLLKSHPNGAHVPDAQFMQAEALFRQEKHGEALPAYQQLLTNNLLGPDRVVMALLHAGQSASQTEDYQTALQLLQRITTEHPSSNQVHEAMFEQGVCLFHLGRNNKDAESPDFAQFDEAMKLFESVATSHRSTLASRARFHMGEVYFQKKMFIDSIRQYQRVMYGFGGNNAPDEVKPWQARAGFQAGQAALVLAGETKDLDRKKRLIMEGDKYFRYVVEKAPDSEVASAAEQRLQR
ncbi:MAG: tetratricopeptide repeat protein, partial [Pirellulaceae bacterium]|nr:tetratricopeptide repeat protein [Pirellulaceae bacterium]